MHLQRIEAYNFRNLSGAIEFSPGLNIIHGANAQGKTAWLEAVYLLATTKSFRTAHPREVVQHGAKEALLRGTVARGKLSKDLQLLVADNAKQTFVNGKREAVTRYLGNLSAIAFTADEMEVVRGAPEARRKFLDRGLVGTLPAYLGTLAEYNRVLKQKNRLLRDAANSDNPASYIPLIPPWNDQLVAYGTEIHQARSGYVEQLRAHLQPELFHAETISLRYKSSLEGKGDLTDYAPLMRERLAHHLKNELSLGYSLVGPHRDDLELKFDGYDIAKYGSSGQQRSALLVLDLAQMSVYHGLFEEYPIFLVDDVDAELDRGRIEILLDFLAGKAQTLVSTSKQTIAARYRNRAATFLVQAGQVQEEERLVERGMPNAPAKPALPEQTDENEQLTITAPAADVDDEESRHHAPF